MSDEHAHDDGAHEIDKMPSGRLFNIVALLGSLTLALCIGVIQLFNQQVRTIENERVAGGNSSQQEYVAEMGEVADGYGAYEIVTPGGEGKPDAVTTRYYIPVEKAEQQLIDNPALLAGGRPDKDWAGTGTGKKVEEWGGLGKPTPREPAARKLGDAKDAAKAKGPRDHRFAFTVSGDDLVLLGEVPSDEDSAAIEAAAKKTHFGQNVRNKLKVTNNPGKPEFKAAYERAVASVDLMSSGTAKWTSGKLSVEGFVPDANQEKFDALAATAGGPPMGTLEVGSTEAADKCDVEFQKALRTPIRFGTGGADIDPKSMKVLDKLSSIAGKCPGKFVVEGHTDDQGEASANKKLSLERANAVSAALVEKGLDKARVRAKGFGQERPLVPNEDEAGRSKNRRIEVHIAR